MPIKFDENFVKNLRQKLTVGNARSIHLNALPSRYATRLDLFNLSRISPSLPQSFLDTLLSKPKFNFEVSLRNVNMQFLSEEEINFMGVISKKLDSIHNENNDNNLEYGVKTFGFGFPLLIRRDRQKSSSIIAAPLIVWNLDIVKSFNVANTWHIKREDDFPVTINEVLISHIHKDENIHLSRLSEEYLEDSIIDLQETEQITNSILEQFGVDNKVDYTAIEKCPYDKKALNLLAQDTPLILWSGVFGLFRNQKESLIKDLDKIIENPQAYNSNGMIHETYTTASVSAVDTDPSQEAILNSLKQKNKIIIQGPPGCGKSQSLTALISNALLDGKKCLVVCEKKTALDVIYNNLSEISLNQYAAVVDDVYKDRQNIVKNIRDRVDRLFVQPFRSAEFDSLLEELNQCKQTINNYYKVLSRPVIGEKRWKEAVAEYLSIAKDHDKGILRSVLNVNDFKFNFDEYNRLTYIVSTGLTIFKELNDFSNPLFLLSPVNLSFDIPAVRVKFNLEDKIREAQSSLKSMADATSSVRTAYGNKYDKYYNDFYSRSSKLNNSLLQLVTNAKRDYPFISDNSFFSTIKFAIGPLFSKKTKQAKQLRKTISHELNGYNQFIQKHAQIILISHQHDYESLITKLSSSHAELQKWYDTTVSNHSAAVSALDTLNTVNDFNFKDDLSAYFSQISSLAQQYAAYGILKDVSLIAFKTSPGEVTSFISAQNELLQKLENNFDDLQYIISWHKFIDSLSSKDEKDFIHNLFDVAYHDKAKLFKAWYLFWYLAYNSEGIPKDGNAHQNLIDTFVKIKKKQHKKIDSFWSNEQQFAMSKLSSKGIPIRALYNLRGNKGVKRNSLRKIIATDLNFFTSYFPVILTNPVACSSIIPLQHGLFDYVIFDEASQLRLEDTFSSLIRGKYKIISGDVHQMPPSNYFASSVVIEDGEDENDENPEEEGLTQKNLMSSLAESESLLKFGSDAGFNFTYLDFHYRSRHPALINFSNAAFYGTRLIPMPPKTNVKPIRFMEVNGIYDNKNGVNVSEADKVLDILLLILPELKSGKYKSVGIATLNLLQRNLILDKIREFSLTHKEFGSVIANLMASKDFFVKNLENIQGDEKDIIIMSTTFGYIEDGTFRQNFGPLIQQKGYKLLNVIITRAKYQLYVVTSIPSEYYLNYASEIQSRGNNGKGVFYTYLAYAKSIEDGNEQLRSSILSLLAAHSGETFNHADYLAESPFEAEVYDALVQHIESGRITMQYKCGGFRIDLVVFSPDGTKPIAIECDGAAYHSTNEAYSWDLYRQKQLQEFGFIFYRIWSANWWENPKRELNNLLQFIHSQHLNK